MARGSKTKYTAKQKRQAHNIEESAKKRGFSSQRAAQIGYATVTKQDVGGKKGGTGRKKARTKPASRRGGRRGRAAARR